MEGIWAATALAVLLLLLYSYYASPANTTRQGGAKPVSRLVYLLDALCSWYLGDVRIVPGRRLLYVVEHIDLLADVRLAHTRYFPEKGSLRMPVVLIRTPYGRTLISILACQIASRGYTVVVQDCRGCYDSRADREANPLDDFAPIRHEGADGVATINWIEKQSFCNGDVVMMGISYLGLVQFAVMDAAPNCLKALVPINAASNLYPVLFPGGPGPGTDSGSGGALALDFLIRWLYMMLVVRDPEASSVTKLWRRLRMTSVVASATSHLPIAALDQVLVGRRIGLFQETLSSASADHPFWASLGAQLCRFSNPNTPPTHIIAGWYDIFVDQALRDFAQLCAADSCRRRRRRRQQHRLTVGPWHHWGLSAMAGLTTPAALAFFKQHAPPDPLCVPSDDHVDAAFAEDEEDDDNVVHLYVRNARAPASQWMRFPSFPPLHMPLRLYLHSLDRSLRLQKPRTDAGASVNPPCRYTFDPVNSPTPSLGGCSFDRLNSGPVNNRPLESRDDVLVFTSAPLTHDLCVIGFITATIYTSSSLPSSDFVVRLLDVAPEADGGASIVLCDGIVRCRARVGSTCRLEVEAGACANVFLRHHRVRVHVASGGHPRWMRHTGTPACHLAHPHHLRAARQTLFTAAHTASYITVPTVPLPGLGALDCPSEMFAPANVADTGPLGSRRNGPGTTPISTTPVMQQQ